LNFEQFAAVTRDVRKVATALGRKMESL
jgi:hypothetical protein